MVHTSVFDAFGWHASTVVEWCSASGIGEPSLPTSANPPGLGFVLRGEKGAFAFLPREGCALHLPRLPLPQDADMLAPWAIDDATDLLYEHRVAPHDALFLATTSLAALYWGLHDWAHFHSHGPFEQIAATELQCDVSALVWLTLNRDVLGLDDTHLEALRCSALELTAARAASEGVTLDTTALSREGLRALVARSCRDPES